MAIDLWSNTDSSGISPRISFSYDVCQTDLVALDRSRSDSLLLESNNFDFNTSRSFEQDEHSSCADELFSDGKILPLEIKKQVPLPPRPPTHHPTENSSKKESLKEIIEKNIKTEDNNKASSSSKSFWRFKRSNSCGNGHKRSLICSLSLLSRSYSTGSTPNPKRTNSSLNNNNNKNSTAKAPVKLSSSPYSGYPYSNSSARKSYGAYNNGIKVSPVLNVPPPYISKGTVNLFGLGSLFCNGKDKNKKKRSDFS